MRRPVQHVQRVKRTDRRRIVEGKRHRSSLSSILRRVEPDPLGKRSNVTGPR
jgi:hypothetical protein